MKTADFTAPLFGLPAELHNAVRRLARTPGLVLATVTTLALALGVNIAMFALVNTIVIQPLPYPQADRLVSVSHHTPGLEQSESGLSPATYFHYRDLAFSFDELGLVQEATVNVTSDGPPERVPLAMVTHTVFPLLGAKPAHGRFFVENDDWPGAPTIVVLSHSFWMRRFGGDPSVVGRSVAINGRSREVVGIAPASFDFPSPETRLWMPMRLDPNEATIGDLYLQGIGRLAEGHTPAAAESELASLVPSLTDSYADLSAEQVATIGLRPKVEPLKKTRIAESVTPLWILLATAGLILLITCANLANLFLVRAERRGHELAVRAALGAGRGDVIRFFLVESALLTALSAALGWLLAAAAIRTIASLGPVELPRLQELTLGAPAVAFTAGVGLLAMVLLGGLPIARYAGRPMNPTLRSGNRGLSASRAQGRTRSMLMVAQVAIASLLLIGAGLLWRSSTKLARTDPGFRAPGVLTVGIALPYRGYPTFGEAVGFYHDLLEALRAQPGVASVGAVSSLPLGATASELQMPIERQHGTDTRVETPPRVTVKLVTAGYFETMQNPWLRGDPLPADGRVGSVRPVIVNEALARLLFPTGNAVGQRIRRAMGNQGEAGEADVTPWNTITGVVGNVREHSMAAPPPPILYLPVLDQPLDPYFVPRSMSLVIRTDLEPASLTPTVRRLVWARDSDLPVAAALTLDDIVRRSTARTRLATQLLLAASGLTLILGTLGVYSVISYSVSRRRHEIGVRLALGARAVDVTAMILSQSTRIVIVGLALGAGAALVLTRHLRDLLYETSPTDPLTFGIALVLLLAVALLATLVPARRMAKVDPIATLDVG